MTEELRMEIHNVVQEVVTKTNLKKKKCKKTKWLSEKALQIAKKRETSGDSLVVQWLRLCLPVHGVRV